LDLKNRLALMVAVAVVLLVLGFWLTLGLRAWGSVALMLQGWAVALVVWVLFADCGKSGGLLMFVVKGFVVSLVLTSVLWFVGALVWVSWFSHGFVFWVFVIGFEYNVLPLSLLPVAMSVAAYGVFRKKLHALLILLSSWYVSTYVVFMAYDVWWFVFILPYLSEPPYFGGAGPILRDMLLVFLAFVVACVFAAVYVGLRKPKQVPP